MIWWHVLGNEYVFWCPLLPVKTLGTNFPEEWVEIEEENNETKEDIKHHLMGNSKMTSKY